MMKKEYISPEAEIFVCKANAILMASGRELDGLLDDDGFDIVPDESWEPDDSENFFNTHEDGFDW